MYSFLVAVVGLIMRIIYRIDVRGRENVPAEGALLLCSNHIHNFDPVLIAIFCRRQIRYMAKAEAFEWAVLGWLIRSVGAFPVKRGGSDIGAVRTSLKLLKSGEVVGIFPEGTRSRSGQLGKPHTGVIMLAESANVPMLPVSIRGEYRFWGRLSLRFGQPVRAEELLAPGETYSREAAAEALMTRIGTLLRDEQ